MSLIPRPKKNQHVLIYLDEAGAVHAEVWENATVVSESKMGGITDVHDEDLDSVVMKLVQAIKANTNEEG